MNESHERKSGLLSRLHYWVRSHSRMTDRTVVLFDCGGLSDAGRFRELYEAMLADERFREFRYIWAVERELNSGFPFLREQEDIRILSREPNQYWNAFAQAGFWVVEGSLPDRALLKPSQVLISASGKENVNAILDSFFPEGKQPFSMREYLDAHPVLSAALHAASDLARWVYHLPRRVWNSFLLRSARYNLLALLRSLGLFQDENYKKLLSYKDKHKGERCFLIGNGPSLKASDLDLLKEEVCFGCNMIHKIYDQTEWRPTYMCATDSMLIYHLFPLFEHDFPYPIFAVFGVYQKMEEAQCFPPEAIRIQSVSRKEFRVHNILSFFSPGGTTMLLMLQMAMFMGFREICMLGVDCTSSLDPKGHFTNDYMNSKDLAQDLARTAQRYNNTEMTADVAGQKIHDRVVYGYSQVEKYAKRHGFKIYNCTRGGALEEFERKSLEAVLGLPEKSIETKGA